MLDYRNGSISRRHQLLLQIHLDFLVVVVVVVEVMVVVVVGIVDYLEKAITAVELKVMVEVVRVVVAEECFSFIVFVKVFHSLWKQENCPMDQLSQHQAHFRDQWFSRS